MHDRYTIALPRTKWLQPIVQGKSLLSYFQLGGNAFFKQLTKTIGSFYHNGLPGLHCSSSK